MSGRCERLRCALALVTLTALLTGCLGPADRVYPIAVSEIRETVAGDKPVRGWVARVDLRDPRVDIRVTGPVARRADDPPALEARAEPTPDWLAREGLVLAVNTHFFARLDQSKERIEAGVPLDLVGPCVSEGVVVSPGKEGEPAPGLALTRARRGRIAMLEPTALTGMDDVVCGVPSSPRRTSSLLVEAGRNTGATASPQPDKRHPRTAAGLTVDGSTLILAVVDGRQPEWSVGMTLPELADLMIRLGAEYAVNLDGGGSSSFVYAPPDGQRVENRPSDGRWRPVGASMGVRVR